MPTNIAVNPDFDNGTVGWTKYPLGAGRGYDGARGLLCWCTSLTTKDFDGETRLYSQTPDAPAVRIQGPIRSVGISIPPTKNCVPSGPENPGNGCLDCFIEGEYRYPKAGYRPLAYNQTPAESRYLGFTYVHGGTGIHAEPGTCYKTNFRVFRRDADCTLDHSDDCMDNADSSLPYFNVGRCWKKGKWCHEDQGIGSDPRYFECCECEPDNPAGDCWRMRAYDWRDPVNLRWLDCYDISTTLFGCYFYPGFPCQAWDGGLKNQRKCPFTLWSAPQLTTNKALNWFQANNGFKPQGGVFQAIDYLDTDCELDVCDTVQLADEVRIPEEWWDPDTGFLDIDETPYINLYWSIYMNGWHDQQLTDSEIKQSINQWNAGMADSGIPSEGDPYCGDLGNCEDCDFPGDWPYGWGGEWGIRPGWTLFQELEETCNPAPPPPCEPNEFTDCGGDTVGGCCTKQVCPGRCCCTHPCAKQQCVSVGVSQDYATWPIVPFAFLNPSRRISIVGDSSGPPCLESAPAMQIDFSRSGFEGATWLGDTGGQSGASEGQGLALGSDTRSATGWTIPNDSCWRTRFWIKAVEDDDGFVCSGWKFQIKVGHWPAHGPGIHVAFGPDMDGPPARFKITATEEWKEFDLTWKWFPANVGPLEIPTIYNSPLGIFTLDSTVSVDENIDCGVTAPDGPLTAISLTPTGGRVLIKNVSIVPLGDGCVPDTGIILRQKKLAKS